MVLPESTENAFQNAFDIFLSEILSERKSFFILLPNSIVLMALKQNEVMVLLWAVIFFLVREVVMETADW